jgi:hypothetical protein
MVVLAKIRSCSLRGCGCGSSFSYVQALACSRILMSLYQMCIVFGDVYGTENGFCRRQLDRTGIWPSHRASPPGLSAWIQSGYRSALNRINGGIRCPYCLSFCLAARVSPVGLSHVEKSRHCPSRSFWCILSRLCACHCPISSSIFLYFP